MQLKCVGFDLCVVTTETIASVKQKIEFIIGRPAHDLRLFHGSLLVGSATSFHVSKYGQTDDDIVEKFYSGEGSTLSVSFPLRGDIGVFTGGSELAAPSPYAMLRAANASSGVEWLRIPAFPNNLTANAVALIARDIALQGRFFVPLHIDSGLTPAGPLVNVGTTAVITQDACSVFRRLVDDAFLRGLPHMQVDTETCSDLAAAVAAGSRADDFKLLLTPLDLSRSLGSAAGSALFAVLGALLGGVSPDVLVLRRTVGTGRWIGWHTDAASCTVQARGLVSIALSSLLRS